MQGTPVDSWVGKIPWRRDRLPTPVFWPREFHELYSPWGCKELDTTEQLSVGQENGKTLGGKIRHYKDIVI